jgi:Flp pilus assembly protein TadD
MEAASAHYFNNRNSPATARVNTEQTLIVAADFMIAEKHIAEALRLLQGAVAEYPESAACYLALGKRLVGQGSGQEALAPLKKTLSLKPGDAEAAELLKKAEELARAKK